VTWQLNLLTDADRALVVDTLRAEAERKERVAKESSFLLVTSSDPGKISIKQQRTVLKLHTDAETLRMLAYDLAEQPTVPEPVTLAEVVEEERAATYPPLAAVAADETRDPRVRHAAALAQAIKDANKPPAPRKPVKRAVKFVTFPDEAEERAAAIAAHPSSQTPTPEDQP
jgi:hypothetical protein